MRKDLIAAEGVLPPLAGEKLTAFVELESATRAFVEYN
jgi:hypothetical protein